MDIRLDEFSVELRRFTYHQLLLFRVLYFLQIGQEAYWKSPGPDLPNMHICRRAYYIDFQVLFSTRA